MIKRDNCHTFFNCKNCKCKGQLIAEKRTYVHRLKNQHSFFRVFFNEYRSPSLLVPNSRGGKRTREQ